MKHLGDITKIHGWEIEPVDVLVGGSPCQDLSVAGLRKGLEGERSGLFMEQIRIIKEMRNYERDIRKRPTELIRPRWCIWENVPGARSSGTPKGEDFRIVLEEFCKIADPSVHVPRPEKWTPHGCIVGDGWSVAWATHNAADWCVPQRRKRVSIVADYHSERAGEILFESESLFRNTEQSGTKRKTAAAEIETGSGAASCTLKVRGGCERDSNGRSAGKGALIQYEQSATLGVRQDQTLFVLEGNGTRDSHRGDGFAESETSYTINTVERHGVCYTVDEKVGQTYVHEDSANTLAARDYKQPQAVCYGMSPYHSNCMKYIERERERERSRR